MSTRTYIERSFEMSPTNSHQKRPTPLPPARKPQRVLGKGDNENQSDSPLSARVCVCDCVCECVCISSSSGGCEVRVSE